MKPRIGISSCLLGERVRYDGGHKRAAALVRWFRARADLVSGCPEWEVGMGVPREPVRLVRGRMRGVETGADWTDAMKKFARRRVRELRLDGWILKARSPSCDPGFGLFARAIRGVATAHEEDLADAAARRAFLDRALRNAGARCGRSIGATGEVRRRLP